MNINKDKKQKVKLILQSKISAQLKFKENAEFLQTQHTFNKQIPDRHTNMSSQFSTLMNSKKPIEKTNQSLNLFSTLMKPKKASTKHHHISCHQINYNPDLSHHYNNNHNNNSNSNNNTSNTKLSTLNVSSKHLPGNSPDNISTDKTISRLKKENKDLLAQLKSQERTISDIIEQKRKAQAKYEASEKKRREMKEEIEVLKANETQLMTILYVLEEKGIPIESIIDKWNAENEPSKTNRSLESAAFTPITLDQQPKCLTKIDNIPKLDFKGINLVNKENGKKKRSYSQK